MSRKRRRAREEAGAAAVPSAATEGAAPPEQAVPRADAWLLAAFLVPNLGALACGYVLDDLPLLVENGRLHDLGRLAEIFRSGTWPDRTGLTLYRPVTQVVWALLWAAGGGRALPFHAANLLLGAAVVLLARRLLRAVGASPRVAFVGALLFALLPIHTEATTSVVGSAELLAALFGLGALLVWKAGRTAAALALFALAVFSKESAAALAGVAALLAFTSPGWRAAPRRALAGAAGSGAVVALALWARSAVAAGPSFVPPVDNPAALLPAGLRVLTALWVQVLYVGRSLFPVVLSADASYREIPLVMGPGDPRAWAGVALAALALLLARRPGPGRTGVLLWAVPFLPAANLLFPIGTLMGERLAYLPSLGLALLVALPLARLKRPAPVLLALGLVLGARTAVRNLDWRSADVFYPRLVETSPGSAKSWYFLGSLRASRGDDAAAVACYDRAVAIFPAYSEAFHNRGNALARLGRRDEAMESYRQCLRFDPGHAGAARNLATLAAGLPLAPPRRPL